MKALTFVLLGVLIGLVVGGLLQQYEPFNAFILCVFSGIIAGACSFFLGFCFNEGNIFANYYLFIDRYFNPENIRHPLTVLFKPLGGCLFCMNVWIGFICWGITAELFNVSFWIFALPSGFFAHISLMIAEKYLN